MKISILVTFILLFTTAVVFSQNEINQLDGQGKRHGIWKKNFNNSEQIRYEGVFNHGKEIEVFKFYCEDCGVIPIMTKSFNKNDAISEVKYFSKKGMMNTYREGKNVDPTRLHIIEWILCIQNGWQTSCDIKAGFAEAIAAHMATLSLKTGKKVYWKESERKVVFESENK